MPNFHIEMNFCRRCGSELHRKGGALYVCAQGHRIFSNAGTGVALILVNDANEVLVLERADDPGKGAFDAPGGICDESETVAETVAREVKEEVGLDPSDYTELHFLFSQVNAYEFDGETRPVQDFVFTARMTTDKQPAAGDDAASARWVPVAELDLDRVFFSSVRSGYAQVIQGL